ncbi:hypothetical protein AC579_10036 [Pseudocercospora musae]|uniref:N-acetyltransferase domain-containing protein n=1 Tax=Pseudocercospora musae TaxID=113226 RepID=A0A139IGT8_9PEZI|nr:hypothetical protein AC579_10036 [Pseudocercospora musae]
MATFLVQDAQPGDGSWLLQKGSVGSTKRNQNRRRSKRKTFLARTDSVVDLQKAFDAEEEGTPLAQPKTFDSSKSLSNYFVPATEASTLPQTIFLSELPPSPPPQDAPPQEDQMAVPPHLRPKAAAMQVTTPSAGSQTQTITEKLSTFGVSVNQPVPSASEREDEDAPIYRGRGGGNAKNRIVAGPSRNTRRDGFRPKSRARDDLNAAKKSSRAGNGAWAHNKDISKGDPDRWEADWAGKYNNPQPTGWAGESNISFDSARADGGLGGNGKKRAVDEASWALTDWEGNWAPAPCDWDSRPAFRADQSAAQIEQWLGCAENALRIRKLELGTPVEEALRERQARPALEELSTVDGITYVFGEPENPVQDVTYVQMGDIIPRQWIPQSWGRQPPQSFWHDEILKSFAPPPEDPGDLEGARPWWELLVKGGQFLPNIPQPAIAGIDPSETKEARLKRESDHGSNTHAENRKRFELAKMRSSRENQRRKEEKVKKVTAAKVANHGISPEQLSKISTNLKVFMRHATKDDMQEIRDLYNYYVDFTCAAYETERVSTKDMARKFDEIRARKLPFLVICEKGGIQKARKKHQEDIILPDKIVGFAFANDLYGPQGNLFRYTVEVEVYVHKDALMRGVAKCLMDKTLALLDPDYLERGGYGVADEDLEFGAARPSRLVNNILINFYHESSRPQKLEWVSRFLKDFAGFERVGYMLDVGSKNVPVSHAIFQRATGASLDHSNGGPAALLQSSPPR